MAFVGGLCGKVLDAELALAAVLAVAGMVEALFYGIHVILFAICLFLLLRRRRRAQWPIFVSAVIMFALSTADVALTFRILSYVLPKANEPNGIALSTRLVQAKDSIFVASNFVAELTLLYRCYMVWDRSKYVLAVCSLFITADTIWGFLGMGPTLLTVEPSNKFVRVYVWSIFSINIFLTFLIVFRILWLADIFKRLLGRRQPGSTYSTATAILAESSVVYSLSVLIFLLWPRTDPRKIYMVVICMRLVGIMPTLLVVQVGLGSLMNQTQKHPTTLSKFHATRPATSASVALSTPDADAELGTRRTRNAQDEDVDIAPLGVEMGRDAETGLPPMALRRGTEADEEKHAENPYSG